MTYFTGIYEGDPKSKVSIMLGLKGNCTRDCWPYCCLLVHPLPNKPSISPLRRSVLTRQPFVMELLLAAPARCEVRAVIRFLIAKGVKPQIHRQLTEMYGESCMNVKNVRKCCREFTAGRTEIHDEKAGDRQFPTRESRRLKKSCVKIGGSLSMISSFWFLRFLEAPLVGL